MDDDLKTFLKYAALIIIAILVLRLGILTADFLYMSIIQLIAKWVLVLSVISKKIKNL